MLRFRNLLIILLGIVITFVLFAEGKRYNRQSTSFGEVVETCAAQENNPENCLNRRSRAIAETYGMPYWELKNRQEQQMVFLIIPAIILFSTLFVVSAAARHEILFSIVAVLPMLLFRTVYYPFSTKLGMAFFYVAVTFAMAWLISRIKLGLFYPQP